MGIALTAKAILIRKSAGLALAASAGALVVAAFYPWGPATPTGIVVGVAMIIVTLLVVWPRTFCTSPK